MEGFVLMLAILLSICYLGAWACAMFIIASIADEKGRSDLKGQLWFIGLFATPIAAGIIAAALPERKDAATAQMDAAVNELPSI